MTQSYTETLKENFANMHTDMLIERKNNATLTEEAKKILEEELIKRGLTEEKIKELNEEEKNKKTNELEGIKGWLILVGIGIVLAPLRLVVSLMQAYKPIFENGVWEKLTTEGSDNYIPNFQLLIVTEGAYNACLIIASIYLIYLFVTRSNNFPKLFIAIGVVSIIGLIADSYFTSLVIANVDVFDAETAKELTKTIVGYGIWIPYMLKSKRVKNTFVK